MAVPKSLPAWGVWIEIEKKVLRYKMGRSLPAWGVWIEITMIQPALLSLWVAPRMGSVD